MIVLPGGGATSRFPSEARRTEETRPERQDNSHGDDHISHDAANRLLTNDNAAVITTGTSLDLDYLHPKAGPRGSSEQVAQIV